MRAQLVAPQVADHELRTTLSNLTFETAKVVSHLASPEAWQPKPGSPGDGELKNTEHGPHGAWGERPIRTAFALAQLLIQTVVQYTRASAVLIMLDNTLLVQETVARGALDAGATAWWLFEDGIGARRRVCRLQLLRIQSALELERAVTEIGQSNTNGDYGETAEMVRDYSADLGLAMFTDVGRTQSAACEGEVRPRYTARVKALLDDSGNKGAYNIYSGTAHSELYAVLRALKRSPVGSTESEGPGLEPADDPRGIKAATHFVLLSLIEPMHRVAGLFGWNRDEAPGAELSTAIDRVIAAMAKLDT